MDPLRGAFLAVVMCLAVTLVHQVAASAPPPQQQPATVPETPQQKSVHLKDAGKTAEHQAARETVSVGGAGEGVTCSGEGGGTGDASCARVTAQAVKPNTQTADTKQPSRNPTIAAPGTGKTSIEQEKPPGKQQEKQSTKQSNVNSGQVPSIENKDNPESKDIKHNSKTQDSKSPQEKEPQRNPANVKNTKEKTEAETKKNVKPPEEKHIAGVSADSKPSNTKPPTEQQPSQKVTNPTKNEHTHKSPSTDKISEVKTPEVVEKGLPAVKMTENEPPTVKSADSKSLGPKPTDTKKSPVDAQNIKRADSKHSEPKPADEKPAETRNAQGKAPEVKSADAKSPGGKSTQVKPTEVKPATSKEAQAKITGVNPPDSKQAEIKPAESNKAQVQTSDEPTKSKPTEAKSTPSKEAQVKTPVVKLSESKPTEVKPVVSKDAEKESEKVKPRDVEKEEVKELPAGEEWPGRAEQPARILAVMPYNARSHFEAFRPLLEALAQRGHQVDVVSHFPLEGDAPPGYRDIAVNGSFPSFEDAVDLDLVADLNAFTDAVATWYETLDVCGHVLETPQLRSLLNSNQKYDLVLNEIFGAECLAGFAHKFNTPVVGLVSSVAPPGALDRVGNPEPPSYVSNYYLPFVPPLSFWQRAASALYGTAHRRLKTLLCDRTCDALARRHFGEGLPSSAQLAARTALVLVNSHPAVNQPRPLVPAVVEVGGMHIGEPRPLPQDLEQLVSGPEGAHGVVIVSLGTMVRLASFPPERLAALWAALGALPQLVLVKSKEDLPGAAPRNVRAFPWLQQFDLLSHPRTRLLLSHGGLLSLQEAVTAGVPVLGMPLFSDQRLNVRSLEAKGAALLIEHSELTHERLVHALRQLLNDPSFRSSAQTLRAQFVDRPRAPLRSAVWWVEYVLRHNGAPHLRCAAADMPQHQVLLLDVAAVLALAVAAALGALWVLLSAVYRAIRFGTTRSNTRLPTVDAEGRTKRYSKHKVH